MVKLCLDFSFQVMSNYPMHELFLLVSSISYIVILVSAVVTQALGNPEDVCSDDDVSADDDCAQHISYSALSYFAISTCILLSCAGAYLMLKKLSFAEHYLIAEQESIKMRSSTKEASSRNPLLNVIQETENLDSQTIEYSDNNVSSRTKGTTTSNFSNTVAQVKEVFNKIRVPAFSVFFVFTVTIGLFPSLVVHIESVSKCNTNATRLNNDLFIPMLFLVFNSGDFAGRYDKM